MMNLEEAYEIADKLCLELSDKKDWSAHQKAEKIKAFLEGIIAMGEGD